ncbi:MAG: DegT/DnrJ/EryC1/StrS family aminotransferase [Pseudomonadota bacterium]
MRKIPLLVPELPTAKELQPFLKRIDAARWYSNFGPLVLELEGRLRETFQRDCRAPLSVCTVSNCTVGLELALQALDLKPGARVLIPGLTFAATAAAVVRAGYEPVVADVDPGSWLLTPEIAKHACAKSRVDAVMPVSTYGCPQDPAAWDSFSGSTGIPVVLDAAGAYGNQRAGERPALVFSLHATKVLSGAEGGFVVSPDAELVARVRQMSNFGIGAGGLVERPGTNAKLSEYHAAVVLAMLGRWDDGAKRRKELHRLYIAALAEHCPYAILQQRPADGVYSIMPVLLPAGAHAADAGDKLLEQGIETRCWYCPAIHRHPAFSGATRAGTLDTVEALGDRLLALPFHLSLAPDDVGHVCRRLQTVLGGAGR